MCAQTEIPVSRVRLHCPQSDSPRAQALQKKQKADVAYWAHTRVLVKSLSKVHHRIPKGDIDYRKVESLVKAFQTHNKSIEILARALPSHIAPWKESLHLNTSVLEILLVLATLVYLARLVNWNYIRDVVVATFRRLCSAFTDLYYWFQQKCRCCWRNRVQQEDEIIEDRVEEHAQYDSGVNAAVHAVYTYELQHIGVEDLEDLEY
jgi:hypothetical protein